MQIKDNLSLKWPKRMNEILASRTKASTVIYTKTMTWYWRVL